MDSLTAGAGSLAQTQEWWRYDHVNDVAIQPAMRLEFLGENRPDVHKCAHQSISRPDLPLGPGWSD
jgi:hypothetical protein